MFLDIAAHPVAFGSKNKCVPPRGQRVGQRNLRVTRQSDAPVTGFGDFFQRPRQIDDPNPRRDFKRTRCRLGKRTRFRRRMAVLSDDRDCAERSRSSEYRADILRVGNLIEDQQWPYVIGVNRCGTDPQFSYNGRSLVVDPHGIIIADAAEQERVISAQLDSAIVRNWRSQFPALKDAGLQS